MANPYLQQVGGALWNQVPQSGADAAKFMAQAPAVPYAQAVGNYFDAAQSPQAQEFAKNFGTPAADQIANAFQPPAPPPQAAPAQAPQPQPEAPAMQPPPGGLPREFHLVRAGSGVATIPAHEMDLRGPTLRNAQGLANATVGQAIDNVGDRNAAAAAHEYGVYLEQERSAKLREDAMMRAQAEREEEMFQRQQDFDTSVKALSQASVDPDRFWASRSTGQKIAGMVGIALGGFLRGAKGGTNPALDMINTAIDRDIKAQEFAYMAQRDAVNAKQTAFSMAMQKFNSADAARSLARAAALDAVQAQLGQTKALYAGTDAANRADMAIAQLEQDKMNQIAQGIRFIPSQQVATAAWVDPRTGLRYTDAEAKAMSGKMDEREFKREEMGLETAGKVIVEGAKAQGDVSKERAKKVDDETRAISSQLQQAGVPQARAAAELALRTLNASRGGFVEGVARDVYPGATKLVVSDAANEREQAYANFKNAAIKAMMGNATESEVARAEAALGSAKSPKAREVAIRMALDSLEQIEKNAKAGASPEAQAEFDRRRQAAEGAPAAAPKGSKAGW